MLEHLFSHSIIEMIIYVFGLFERCRSHGSNRAVLCSAIRVSLSRASSTRIYFLTVSKTASWQIIASVVWMLTAPWISTTTFIWTMSFSNTLSANSPSSLGSFTVYFFLNLLSLLLFFSFLICLYHYHHHYYQMNFKRNFLIDLPFQTDAGCLFDGSLRPRSSNRCVPKVISN